MRKYTKILFGLAGLCVVLLGLFYAMGRPGQRGGISVETGASGFDLDEAASEGPGAMDGDFAGSGAAENDAAENAEESSAALICVYVCGQVVSPGIYYLEEGSRVAQAIEAAGGVLPSADMTALNPAVYACDSQKIYVPAFGESRAAMEWQEDRGSGAVQDAVPGLVNINTADAVLLESLPGIGRVKAESIIAYREENGYFRTVGDIKNVPGIKEASYEKIKGLICV